MLSVVTISFFAFLAGFTAIGVYATTRKKDTPEDYLIASRGVGPWLVALSAVATQNSGFMFIGLTGAAYSAGLSGSVWVMLGWIIGDAVSWTFVHKRLRVRSEAMGAHTIPEFLGGGLRNGRLVVIAAALITLVFLGLYASAQLTAGRKALEEFSIGPNTSVILGAGMVAAYCFAGGIRASIWTDAAQSIVMIVSMTMLFVVAVVEIGGMGAMWSQLEAIDPTLTTWIPRDLEFGFALFFLGWIAAGFGVVGQPHVMIRAMALDSPDSIGKARIIYIAWFAFFSVACVGVGLAARVLMTAKGFDPELAFPRLSDYLLPGVLVGMMLAGVFAATISTADSQVLSCSAAITQDLFPRLRRSYTAVKLATLLVTAAAMSFALVSIHRPALGGSVFKLVVFAWSALAAGLGPLLIVRALGARINAAAALAMMTAGIAAVLVWRFALHWQGYVYDALPGMLAGTVVYLVAFPLTAGTSDEH